MQRWERRLVRVVRALLACWVLSCVAQTPAQPAGWLRDAIGWRAPVSHASAAAPRARRTARATRQASAPAPVTARAAVDETSRPVRAPRGAAPAAAPARDGRHRYLELQHLIC